MSHENMKGTQVDPEVVLRTPEPYETGDTLSWAELQEIVSEHFAGVPPEHIKIYPTTSNFEPLLIIEVR